MLTERGHRPTAHRLAVLALLNGQEDNLTLAELDALQRRAKHPASAATLYRTLALLVEVELAARATGEDHAARYTPR